MYEILRVGTHSIHFVRGSGIKIGKKKIAPNAIFRVVSCLYILYDLTCSIWLKNSTHSHSYKAYCCFTVFFTSDWLVTHSSPLMIKPQWCQIALQSVALCQTACHILLLSHSKCSYEQSVTFKIIILLNTHTGAKFWKIGVWANPNDDVVSWLMLQEASDCKPRPYRMHTMCFSTLICCGWAYGFTLTL